MNSRILAKVGNVVTAKSVEEKREIISQIGLLLLEDGYIYPIAHYKKFVYAKKSISFNKISQLMPDVRLYKLERLNEN